AGAAQASCGSAFCVLNTNWSTQGVASEPGSFRLDERFEFATQKHRQSGTKRISQADDTADTTELRTINRNLLTTLDYTVSKNWAVSVSVPVVDRSHSHIADPTGAATFEKWDFTKVGDTRVLGMYRFDNEKNPVVSQRLIFGLKLPTGSYRVSNADRAVAARALQPGPHLLPHARPAALQLRAGADLPLLQRYPVERGLGLRGRSDHALLSLR